MRTITNKELIEAAQSEWDAKTLACQYGAPCKYMQTLPVGYDVPDEVGLDAEPLKEALEVHCGVGAAMTPEERQLAIEAGVNTSTIDGLINRKIVKFENLGFAREFQMAHDNWYNGARISFQEMIERPDPSHEVIGCWGGAPPT